MTSRALERSNCTELNCVWILISKLFWWVKSNFMVKFRWVADEQCHLLLWSMSTIWLGLNTPGSPLGVDLSQTRCFIFQQPHFMFTKTNLKRIKQKLCAWKWQTAIGQSHIHLFFTLTEEGNILLRTCWVSHGSTQITTCGSGDYTENLPTSVHVYYKV